MRLTVRQVPMSMTLTAPSFRFGVASTVRPPTSQVMPEPRCGSPGRSISAIRRPESSATTWPKPSREAPIRCA